MLTRATVPDMVVHNQCHSQAGVSGGAHPILLLVTDPVRDHIRTVCVSLPNKFLLRSEMVSPTL